ncbi:PaaI family thioesterase [Aurantiacibacter flavus]|uniref:PaaI family thioesterase n=1 Tax=Aurantiacibacter flavus TaxID=3145232 RepID=A0ABV0CU14_9SPHN
MKASDPASRREHPDHPGWIDASFGEAEHYNRAVVGTLLIRREGPQVARLRMMPEEWHKNQYGVIHGGMILGLIDIAGFAAATELSDGAFPGGVTIELNNHFVGSAEAGRPLDAVAQIVRETGKMLFVRGTVEQDGAIIGSWSSILRKIAAS